MVSPQVRLLGSPGSPPADLPNSTSFCQSMACLPGCRRLSCGLNHRRAPLDVLSMSSCLCGCLLGSRGFCRHRMGAWQARVALRNATFGREGRSASHHLGPWAQARGGASHHCLPSTSLLPFRINITQLHIWSVSFPTVLELTSLIYVAGLVNYLSFEYS